MKKAFFAVTLIITMISCQSTTDNITTKENFFNEKGRMVTPESYPKDETSRQILMGQSLVGVNKFMHLPQLTPTDNQPVVRMNRDTYYSRAVVDVSRGASIIMPEIPKGKYMSVQPVTEDHRIQAMKYGPGTFNLTTHMGTHLYLIIRLDATFTETEAKEIQDKMRIKAVSDKLFETEPVNKESFYKIEEALKAKMPDIVKREGINALEGMFTDPQDESNKLFTEEKYQVGAAIGWGGAQMVDNIYEISANFSTDGRYKLTFEDPENTAFWSVTVYDKNGFMFNDLANYSSNTSQPNEDGTYTIRFGFGNDTPNNLKIANPSNVFNIAVRHYQPSKRVLEEGYRLVPFIKDVSNNQ